jgi:hypothetical protein
MVSTAWAMAEFVTARTDLWVRDNAMVRKPVFRAVPIAPSRISFSRDGAPRHKTTEELLAAIDEAIGDAIEEGDPRPSDEVIEAARALAREIALLPVDPPMVHSNREGGLEFDFRGRGTKSGVLLICEPDGSGACIWEIDGIGGSQRCDLAQQLLSKGAMPLIELLAKS